MVRLEHSSSHSVEISVAKAICIILMVVGHSGCPLWLRNTIYLFHMPCFFFISGFLFKSSCLEQGFVFYLKKKIKSLYFPFITFGILFLTLHNLFVGIGFLPVEYDISVFSKKAVQTLLFMPVVPLLGAIWFLYRLFLVSVICYWVIELIKYKRNIACILISIILVIVSSIITFYDVDVPVIGSLTLQGCAFYLLGYSCKERCLCTKRHHDILKKYRMCIMLLGGILILLGRLYSLEIQTVRGVEMLILYVTGILGSLCIFCLCIGLTNNSLQSCVKRYVIKTLDYLGKHTMDILIFHFLSFKLFGLLLCSLFGYDYISLRQSNYIGSDALWMIYSFLGITLSLAIASVTNKMKMLQKHYINSLS